jgi:tRNA(Ile)-lysidine synthase TilS/MesJ
MCGIFSIIAKSEDYKRENLVEILETLAKLSQVRGKDSSGLAFRFEYKNLISVLRGPVSIDVLLKSVDYQNFKKLILNEVKDSNSNKVFAALGHARLVTNGSQLEDNNNQPVVKEGIVGIHNGIIVNEADLWIKHQDLIREYEIDTEIMFSLFRKYLKEGYSSIQSSCLTNSELFGTVSSAFFINDRNEFVTFTNNGSLYILSNFKDLFILGSEFDILKKLKTRFLNLFDNSFLIKQVPANEGFIVQYDDFQIKKFDLKKFQDKQNSKLSSIEFDININNYKPKNKQLHAVIDSRKFANGNIANSERKYLEYNIDKISKLKRCSKCLLPATFPFIQFNEKGVCNFCINYIKKNQPKSIEELQVLVEPYRRADGLPDCLVPFSGGRDSTYTLHIVKNILKMNPIAFTYDWGMVTDLGRRNIARVCGKMGVENIIVSADIHWKRSNIRKNILAWLKNPSLGMIPLFMAGDKFFFYYTDKVKKQNNIRLNIWGINPLENTDFKVGFCGVAPRFQKKRIYSLSISDQLKLFGFVGRNFLKSPSYLNQSLLDTFGSFASRYFVKKEDYYHMFDYYQWDENEIEDLIINEYKWETATDTKTTWRIGDGTAGFYNYIYFTVAGFSEYDTFRSNQIREGMLDRSTALKLVNEENFPRYESIKWYLEIIGLDFADVIQKINKIPKLY